MPIDHCSDAVSDISVDEQALVSRVAEGDRGALEMLCHSYYYSLAGLLWRAIGHWKCVEEIVYDTFAWVWMSAGNFREAERVSTWIFRIAYRKALEYMSQPMSPAARHRTRRPPEQFIAVLNDRGFSDGLTQRLRVIPFEQRLTLLLTYQMGYSLEQIATITGVPTASVNARLLRARETLGRSLPAGETTVSDAAEG
jgi:RNA polymerase sigma-70 factor (ECF subfamily)